MYMCVEQVMWTARMGKGSSQTFHLEQCFHSNCWYNFPSYCQGEGPGYSNVQV
jgi:hypothetical protein